jgi:hypothetical protein
MTRAVLAGGLYLMLAVASQAQIRITEVASWSSSNSPFMADWFELTNFGNAAVDITGWRIDDGSALFADSVPLNGVTSVGPNESVIFGESAVSLATAFKTAWFNNTAASVQVGTYTGDGLGLSSGGDGVNIYNGAGTLQASVSFGAADATSPFQTFDNSAGLNGVSLPLLSSVGVNGAFVALGAPTMIGSPGKIPEPCTALLAIILAAAFAGVRPRRNR